MMYDDVILFYQSNKFYGCISYGSYIDNRKKYDDYLNKFDLEISMLSFCRSKPQVSPQLKVIEKAVNSLLFDVGVDLNDNVRELIFSNVFFDTTERLYQLISNIAEVMQKKYIEKENVSDCGIIDLDIFKNILFDNLTLILEDLGGE